MLLEIITPDKKVFKGEVVSVTFPGVSGSFQVLENHAPIVSALNKGILKYQSENGDQEVEIDGGVVEVNNNKVIVLAE